MTPLFIIDQYALFYIAVDRGRRTARHAAVLWVLGAARRTARGISISLLLLATLGAATLVASNHFASFFLGLELLSVSLYALIAYLRDRHSASKRPSNI